MIGIRGLLPCATLLIRVQLVRTRKYHHSTTDVMLDRCDVSDLKEGCRTLFGKLLYYRSSDQTRHTDPGHVDGGEVFPREPLRLAWGWVEGCARLGSSPFKWLLQSSFH